MTYLERLQNTILVLLTWTMTLVTLVATLDVIYTPGQIPNIATCKPADQRTIELFRKHPIDAFDQEKRIYRKKIADLSICRVDQIHRLSRQFAIARRPRRIIMHPAAVLNRRRF